MNKICSKCKEELELNSINFEPRKNTKDGFRNQCRNCRSDGKKVNYKYKDNYFWSDYEKEILKKYYPITSSIEINRLYLPNRTTTQITDHATKILKLNKNEDYSFYWSTEQLEYLKNNYENMDISVKDIAHNINKSESTTTQMANKLNLHRARAIDEEILNIIRKYYPKNSAQWIVDNYLPDKTTQWVTSTANSIDVFKDEEHYATIKKYTAIKNLKNIGDQKGENSPLWVDRKECNCTNCKIIIYRKESNTKDKDNLFCSTKCMGEWMSKNRIGENNSNYGNTWDEAMRLKGAELAVSNLKKMDKNYSLTKPQIIINDLLDGLKINYESEYDCKYYLLDNYLTDFKLGIEVQGNFFHCNPVMQLQNSRETFIKRKDKSKHTYIKKYHGFEVLYLWEYDIVNNLKTCESLIKQYINNNGILDNYHSFNYHIVKENKLELISNLYKFDY